MGSPSLPFREDFATIYNISDLIGASVKLFKDFVESVQKDVNTESRQNEGVLWR